MNPNHKILDMCCGGKMFWFDKNNPLILFNDIRDEIVEMKDGNSVRRLDISPNSRMDFRKLEQLPDEMFRLVVFDPPHLLRSGKNSWMAKKYGVLDKNTWQDDIKAGFDEAMRVLEPYGVLVFKWSNADIHIREILRLTPYKPLFGDKTGSKRWLVFMKEERL